jgi:hypothetical protein
MLCDMERPIRRSRGRPGIDKFWAVDAMIINGAEELMRNGRGRYPTPSGAIREFVRRLWSGDVCAILAILPAANAHFLDDMLKEERRVVVDVGCNRVVVDDLDQFRPQAIGASAEAVFRRVLRRLEPTVVRYCGGRITTGPLFVGVLAKGLDRRRGRRPRRALVE